MCIVDDEVEGNSSLKGNGYIGDTLNLSERNFNPQSKTFNKDKRFTLIDLTTIIGKPLMCWVIFKGKKIALRRKVEYTLLSRLIIILIINKSLLRIILNMRKLVSSH